MSTDVSPPEPLDLDEVKLNLRVDGDDEDQAISDLIVTAREHVEDYTGLVLTPREVFETVPSLGNRITLKYWPIASKDDIAISYYDHSGALIAIDPSQWYAILTEKPARLIAVRPGWGISGGFGPLELTLGRSRSPILPFTTVFTLQAGYQTPDDIPATVKRAMHLLIGHFYANRSGVESGARAAAIELPLGVKDLLRRWRKRSA